MYWPKSNFDPAFTVDEILSEILETDELTSVNLSVSVSVPKFIYL